MRISGEEKSSALIVHRAIVELPKASESRLRIEGCLDAITAVELRPVIDEVVGEPPRRVVVDLSALRLIDSSGVGALVSLYKRMREKGGTVIVEGLRDQPLAIFRLLRLDRVFE